MEFTPLASSSAGCCYKLSAPGIAPLLIETGIRFEEIRRALNFQVTELAGCLISHAHADHSRSWKDLAKSSVSIYASVETWGELGEAAFERYDSLPLRVGSRGHVLKPRREIEIGPHVHPWVVLPFEAVHDQPGTLGFVIGSPSGDRLLYLTDSCYSPYRFDGLTMIACECNHSLDLIRENAARGDVDRERFHRTVATHMSLERLLELLKANDLSKVEQIFLLHLSNANSDEIEFKRAVERATGIPCTVAQEKAKL